MIFAFATLGAAAGAIGAMMLWVLNDPDVKKMRMDRRRRFDPVAHNL